MLQERRTPHQSATLIKAAGLPEFFFGSKSSRDTGDSDIFSKCSLKEIKQFVGGSRWILGTVIASL